MASHLCVALFHKRLCQFFLIDRRRKVAHKDCVQCGRGGVPEVESSGNKRKIKLVTFRGGLQGEH